MRAEDTLHLVTAGRDFASWKSVRVRRSMVQCAGGFELAVAWRSSDHEGPRHIAPGEGCEVKIGEDLVITGYVDRVDAAIDATSHEVRVDGRDKTADLVDCSAVRGSGQWRGQKIEAIAAELAKPFGVRVRAEVDTGAALQSFALQEGESVFEAVERAARLRGLLLMSDAQGALVITRAGANTLRTHLAVGENVLAARVCNDMRDRFSTYTIKGQSPGSDFQSGKQVSQMQAKATDPGVTRHRPLLLNNDAPDLAATLRQRAQWEANVRAAQSVEVELLVQGWRHADGLWETNAFVQVYARELALDTTLLIVSVEFMLSDQGTTTRLALTRADAFTLLPLKASVSLSEVYLPPAKQGSQVANGR